VIAHLSGNQGQRHVSVGDTGILKYIAFRNKTQPFIKENDLYLRVKDNPLKSSFPDAADSILHQDFTDAASPVLQQNGDPTDLGDAISFIQYACDADGFPGISVFRQQMQGISVELIRFKVSWDILLVHKDRETDIHRGIAVNGVIAFSNGDGMSV
jgi:hypothetical protein